MQSLAVKGLRAELLAILKEAVVGLTLGNCTNLHAARFLFPLDGSFQIVR